LIHQAPYVLNLPPFAGSKRSTAFIRACLKSRMRGHVIVGVMTINTDVDKLYDTDLSDTAWALIAPMLPAARPGGRPLWIRLPVHELSAVKRS
jgi:hypothetical protein